MELDLKRRIGAEPTAVWAVLEDLPRLVNALADEVVVEEQGGDQFVFSVPLSIGILKQHATVRLRVLRKVPPSPPPARLEFEFDADLKIGTLAGSGVIRLEADNGATWLELKASGSAGGIAARLLDGGDAVEQKIRSIADRVASHIQTTVQNR